MAREGVEVNDSRLQGMSGLTKLQASSQSKVEVSDTGLRHLDRLRDIRVLDLRGITVCDARAKARRKIDPTQNAFAERSVDRRHRSSISQGADGIERLELAGTDITDAGLEHVKTLTKLQWLDLDRTAVGDRGLGNLRALTSVMILSLNDTKVTDVGLESLKGLSRLRELQLRRSRVTRDGVKRLRQALPGCTIHW